MQIHAAGSPDAPPPPNAERQCLLPANVVLTGYLDADRKAEQDGAQGRLEYSSALPLPISVRA
jgi:hypothetical protein